MPLKTPPASRTPSSVTIDCSPSGLEGLRSRAGERPQSRVPNYGLASDLGICERPPTKHRGGGTPGAAALRNTGESRRMNRGGGFSRGGPGGGQREPSRGIGGLRGFTGGRGMGGGASYTPMGSAMGSARGKPPRRERRGSNHGESGMTIGCDAYRKAGQMGGSMAYM